MSAPNPPHESEPNGSSSNQGKDKGYRVIDWSILQCAICQGVIQNTITVMECFHKFCNQCIEKSMRLGVHECPVCHVPIDSPLSLKEDPQYDALVSAVVSQAVKAKKKEEAALHLHGRTNDQESNTTVSREQARSNRLARFIDHLRQSDVNLAELEIHLVIVSLDEQKIPSLQEPYLLCRPTCSVKTLCKYVEIKTKVLEDQVELFLIEESGANVLMGDITIDPDKVKLRVLRGEQTLAQLYTRDVTNCGHLLLGYKMK